MSLQPDLAHHLEPRRRQHLDILPLFCDVAIFCAVNVAHNKMRYVRGQIELDGGAQVSADAGEDSLLHSQESIRIVVASKHTRCSGLILVQQRTAPASTVTMSVMSHMRT